MKITIDDSIKQIEIEDSVNLGELYNFLKGINIDINKYTLKQKVVIVKEQITLPIHNPYQPSTVPYRYGDIMCESGVTSTNTYMVYDYLTNTIKNRPIN